jgi:mRNA-degrading endonuclease RelE of RelBE toxin-antitoxin system
MGWLSDWKERKRKEAARKEFEPVLQETVASAEASAELLPEDRQAILTAVGALSAGYKPLTCQRALDDLKRYWTVPGPAFMPVRDSMPAAFNKRHLDKPKPEAPLLNEREDARVTVKYSEESALRPALRDQLWEIAMSPAFLKAVRSIDRKMQGRILEALLEICKRPMTPNGDTVRPLSREMRGLWRYRLGDFRLIYKPVPERGHVILVTFDSRGSVYS